MAGTSILARCAFLLSLSFLALKPAHADPGTEAASFLDIPVGGRAAALGASYSALATDAYAPIWNPAGLGFLDSTQVAGMHLSYLETISYEFASFVQPVSQNGAVGVAVQYLSPGDIPSTDLGGSSIGTFSGHYGAYSLAYGQKLGEQVSIGASGKMLEAKIGQTSGTAFAGDLGSLYAPFSNLRLGAVISNIGSKLAFFDQKDALPSNARLGFLYQPLKQLSVTAEGVYRFTGLASFHTGFEWMPAPLVSLRAGYRTDTTKGLSALAGFTTGVGLHVWGQEFDYAWVPLGDLGNTQYFSLILRFGSPRGHSNNLQGLERSAKPETSAFTPHLAPLEGSL